MAQERQLVELVLHKPPLTDRKALADLFAVIRADGRIDSVMELWSGAAHESFCPALHILLAQALPDPQRAIAVRAVLWDN